MPRFFFDVYDGQSDRDKNGTVLRGVEEARQEAIRLAGAILKETCDLGSGDWRLEVNDEHGEICFVLGFSVFGRAAFLPVANTACSRRNRP